MARSIEIARAFVTIEAETKGLEQQLSQAEKSLGRTATFVQNHPIAAVSALGAAAIAAGISLIRMAEETNKALGVIADRVPGATGRIADLREETTRLAVQYARTHDEVRATMDAVSKAGAKSVDDLLLVTEAALRAGAAIGKNGQELVEGLDAALDIFGLSAKEATAAMALFFAAAQGRTSMEDLLGTIIKLAPAIQGTGLDLATTTRALVAIIDSGFEPGKKSIAEFKRVLEEGGIPAIKALAGKVQIDGVEAMNHFTEAINRNTSTMDANIQKAQSEWKGALLDIGSALKPIGEALGWVVHQVVKTVTDPNGFKSYVQQLAAAKRESQDAATSMENLGKTGGIAATSFQGLTAAQKGAIESSQKLTEEQKDSLLKATTLSKEQVAWLKTAVKEQSEAAVKARKEADAVFQDIVKLGQKSQRDLLTGHQKEMADLVAQFEEKITELEGKGGKERVEQARAILAKAKQDLVEHWAGIDQDITPQIAKQTETVGQVGKAYTDLDGPLEAYRQRTQGLTAVEREARDAMIDHALKVRETISKWIDKVDEASAKGTEWAGTILDIARNLGISNQDLEESFQRIVQIDAGIHQVGQSIKDLMQSGLGLGEGISGILGLMSGTTAIIGGLGGILKSVFGGESASARFIRLALEKTTAALERHRQALGDLIAISAPGAKVAGAQAGLAAALKPGAIRSSPLSLDLIKDSDLAKFLSKQNLKLSDIEDLAKELGVSIRNDKGVLSRTLLNAFLALLGDLDTAIPQDFAGKLDFITTQAKFRGAGKQDVLKDVIDLVTKSSPFLAAAFAGFDPSTPEGRAAIAAAIPAIFANRGAVGAAGLGELNLKQFNDVLDLIFGLIQDLKEQKGQPAPGEQPAGAGAPAGAPGGEPTPVTTEPGHEPLPVAPSPALSDYFEQLIAIDARTAKAVEALLGRFPEPGALEAPELPSGIFDSSATRTGRGRHVVNINGNISVSVVVREGTDAAAQGQVAADAFLRRINVGLGRIAFDEGLWGGDVSR